MSKRPWHEPTDANRKLARTLSAVGIRHEDIAAKLDISADTLTKYYRKELDDGRVDANASVAQTLYQQAKSGNTTAMIFWLKTQAGWRERDRLEITGAGGGPLQIATVEWTVVRPDDKAASS